MSDRITNSDLEGMCRRVNRMVNGTDDVPVWTTLHDLEEAPFSHANIGVFYIDGAYGGVAFYRIMSEGGGVTDVFGIGHVPKRELYHAMHAFIRGLEQETAEPAYIS